MTRDCKNCDGIGIVRAKTGVLTPTAYECPICEGWGWVDEPNIVNVDDELHKILGEALAKER